MIIGSLLYGYINPGMAFYPDVYNVDGERGKRLMGLLGVYRSLGLYCLILFLMELIEVKENSYFSNINLMASSYAIYLTMSKSSIILLFFIIIVWLIRKARLENNKIHVMFISMLFIFLTTLLIKFVFSEFIENNIESITSFTGRAYLWEETLSSWTENPIFGNGLKYFGGDGYLPYINSHNIIIQSLSDGGLIGLFGLLIFIFCISKAALINMKKGEFFSIASILILLLFSMSEIVIEFSGLYSGEFFIFLFIMLYTSLGSNSCRK